MAETGIRKYAVIERLNKMDVDLIDVTLTTDVEALSNNDVIAQSIEIPNAVSVLGGSAIIQSIMLLDEDDEVIGWLCPFCKTEFDFNEKVIHIMGNEEIRGEA